MCINLSVLYTETEFSRWPQIRCRYSSRFVADISPFYFFHQKLSFPKRLWLTHVISWNCPLDLAIVPKSVDTFFENSLTCVEPPLNISGDPINIKKCSSLAENGIDNRQNEINYLMKALLSWFAPLIKTHRDETTLGNANRGAQTPIKRDAYPIYW